ncbi:MAG: hypothetical protein PVJ67_02145 [Candidatus Pacearchaeota archaeon]|jgi:hypothetical protein
MVKIKNKYSLLDIFEDYFWIIGLSLVIVGGTKFFERDPLGIFISGVILLLVGVFLKSINKK